MNNYVTISVETSGLCNSKDEIIELSAIKVRRGKIVDRFSSLVKPQRALSSEVERLTHITNESLRSAPSINEVLPEYLKFIGGNPLVAHNIGFDIRFLNTALKRSGMRPLKNKTVDTVKLAKRKCRIKRFSICAVADFLSIDYETLADDELVYHIYEKLKR